MKHFLPFGTMKIPDNWENNSSYHFLSPPETTLNIPLLAAGANAVTQVRASVVVTRARKSRGTMVELTRFQCAELKSKLPKFRLLNDAPWKHEQLGDVAGFEFTFEIASEILIHQTQLFLEHEDDYVILVTFSCEASCFEAKRAEFQLILSGILPGEVA